jgi:subtilase family serine protease
MLLNRRRMARVAARAAIAAVAGSLAATAATATTGTAATAAARPPAVVVSAVLPAAARPPAGVYHSARMSVEVVLASRNPAGLRRALATAYAHPQARGRWLAKGQFTARYAPSAAARSAAAYLRGQHLAVSGTGSPFLLRATGTSAQVAAAFHTTLKTYKSMGTARVKAGTYFANATPAVLPAAVAAGVLGVVGLTSTVRTQAEIRPRAPAARAPAAKRHCELPYPSRKQMITIAQTGAFPPTGYGAAPNCNGLSPAQTNSIYSAPHVGARGKGQGVTLGLFELSAYQPSDIRVYTTEFFGPTYDPPLTDINVDGGPVHPICPLGDTCPAELNGYAGDIEVTADIQTQLAVAPDVARLLVYNAPNDVTGQTVLDEYARIASDDLAESISSSWEDCEDDVSAGYVEAENLIFEQMALQGQSMFAGSGDDGAFDCSDITGSGELNVADPAVQPWVTSVGGTSLETFNPGRNAHPRYPQGIESAWNSGNLCNRSKDEGGMPGLFYCSTLGASGGGNSQYWGRPAYQHGPGVTSKDSTRGNGSTHCALAARGTLCREMPDISANADLFTPYAEFCTSGFATTNSLCTFSSDQVPPGWFGIGGTSLSGPVWAGIFADRDSYLGRRSGNANPLVYQLYRTRPHAFFHDITGIGQSVRSNGKFRTRPGYDLVTGIGTPIMAALITKAG